MLEAEVEQYAPVSVRACQSVPIFYDKVGIELTREIGRVICAVTNDSRQTEKG